MLTPPKAGWCSVSGTAVPSSDWDADLVSHFSLLLLALPVGLDVTSDCLIQTAFLVLIFLVNAFLKQFVSLLPLNATRSTFYAMCFVNRELFKHRVKSFLLSLFFSSSPFCVEAGCSSCCAVGVYKMPMSNTCLRIW